MCGIERLDHYQSRYSSFFSFLLLLLFLGFYFFVISFVGSERKQERKGKGRIGIQEGVFSIHFTFVYYEIFIRVKAKTFDGGGDFCIERESVCVLEKEGRTETDRWTFVPLRELM